MIYIGIDPGATGAIALLYNEGGQEVLDFTDPMCLNAMEEILDAGEEVKAMIEKQWLRKGDSTRVGVLIENYGIWIGRCQALCIDYNVVASRTWKAKMGVTSDKNSALDAARFLFPNMVNRLARQKDHNRAEALLIAEYGRRISDHKNKGRV